MSKVLFRASIRGFEPATASKDESSRKKLLKDEILQKMSITQQDRDACGKAKRLSIEAHFYLYSKSGVRGRTEKDLDNLLKILFDVLSDRMDNLIPPTEGLSLIKDDTTIYEIHCSKALVNNESEEGVDFAIHSVMEK